MPPDVTPIVYRITRGTAAHECPLCGTAFTTGFGLWPHLESTNAPLCRRPECLEDNDISDDPPCDKQFALKELDQATLEAIARTDESLSVAERLRMVAIDESISTHDRDLLCRASTDLAFCEADHTRIQTLHPRVVLETCDDAAAEMLLSGCGDILQ